MHNVAENSKVMESVYVSIMLKGETFFCFNFWWEMCSIYEILL